MKIGFTGTREGMTENQKRKLYLFVKPLAPSEFHHGDCKGSDEEATRIVRPLQWKLHSHPPTVESGRAFTLADVEYDPKEFLDRNHDIVDETEVLLAAPRTSKEELRSGTWATIRYARKRGKLVVMLYPQS